jgi:hypothetical protein
MLRTLPLLLLLAVPAVQAAETPHADPSAVQAMREVYQKRYTWDPQFPGFHGKLTVVYGGKRYTGNARVGRDLSIHVELPDEEARKWADEELGSMVLHRKSTPFESGDGRYALTWGTADSHPGGRLVRLNDGMDSTYRIRDGQILQVNRSAGPQMRFTIDIMENIRTEDGRYLPRIFTVAYFKTSGGLTRTETFWDSYQKAGKYYLPEARRQVAAEGAATESNALSLTDLALGP